MFPIDWIKSDQCKMKSVFQTSFFCRRSVKTSLAWRGLSVASSSPLQAFKTNLEEMEKHLIFFDVSIPSYYLIMRLDWWNVEGVTNLNCKSKSWFSCQVDELTIRAWFRSLQQQLLRGAGDEIVMRWCVADDEHVMRRPGSIRLISHQSHLLPPIHLGLALPHHIPDNLFDASLIGTAFSCINAPFHFFWKMSTAPSKELKMTPHLLRSQFNLPTSKKCAVEIGRKHARPPCVVQVLK